MGKFGNCIIVVLVSIIFALIHYISVLHYGPKLGSFRDTFAPLYPIRYDLAASKEELSSSYPKIAYIFAGSVRSFVCPKVHWSIRLHLIDALGGDPYVFVRVSSEDNLNIKTGKR
jgi:hypothetical protein